MRFYILLCVVLYVCIVKATPQFIHNDATNRYIGYNVTNVVFAEYEDSAFIVTWIAVEKWPRDYLIDTLFYNEGNGTWLGTYCEIQQQNTRLVIYAKLPWVKGELNNQIKLEKNTATKFDKDNLMNEAVLFKNSLEFFDRYGERSDYLKLYWTRDSLLHGTGLDAKANKIKHPIFLLEIKKFNERLRSHIQ